MKKETEIKNEIAENNVDGGKENAKTKSPKITKVGAMLKEMRLQKGLKIVDVSRKLCIRKCYLEAIEESSYKDIPLFPYGIGFIRSYAKFLGLNDQNIVDLYKEETQMCSPNDIKELSPQTEASIPGVQYLIISLLAVALISVGWVFMNSNEETNNETMSEESVVAEDEQLIITEEIDIDSAADETKQASAPEGDVQIAVSEESYVETNDAKESEADAKKEEIKSEPKEEVANQIPDTGVFIEVLKETWVEVKDENKLYLSKVLLPKATYAITDIKGKILSVGKHDGVNVYINGKKTTVFTVNKKTNVALDKFLENL